MFHNLYIGLCGPESPPLLMTQPMILPEIRSCSCLTVEVTPENEIILYLNMRKLVPEEKESEEVVVKKNERRGLLFDNAVSIFMKAYGLNGRKRMSHEKLISDAVSKYKCSERAVHALIYG